MYYNRIDLSEGIHVNKSIKLKECIMCHYWYFLDQGYKYEPEVSDGCRDTLVMAYELENIAIQ